MAEALWIYLINAALLIDHEIDSAYWKEWDLYKLRGGITAFLIVHLPLLFLALYGVVLVFERNLAGLIISLLLGIAGICVFTIHMFFIRKGRNEFSTPMSMFILIASLVVSLVPVNLMGVLLLCA